MLRMDPVVASVIALGVAYVLGGAPLGGLLVRRATGLHPRQLNPHLLGVENVLRVAGPQVAVASFVLDLLKGLLVVALFQGNPWAALGVYAGHLHPLPWLRWFDAPRGRGNGVLLGLLAGLAVTGTAAWWLLALPIWVYAGLLTLTRFVSLATAAGLVALPLALLLVGAPAGTVIATAFLAVVGMWRQKAALGRVLDGTEVRLGQPPAVLGLRPDVVLAAFMVHPITLDDLWQPLSQRLTGRLVAKGWLPERWLRRALLLMRPMVQAEISGIRLSDGRELRVLLITGAMLPDQIRAFPDVAERMAIQGARMAREFGAEAFGLGAFWSTVGDKGQRVQDAVPEIAVTNGGAYTAATVKAAVPGLLERFAASGGTLSQACAAVVGANGVVAFGVARSIAGDIGKLILVGRDPERLTRSAATLQRKHPELEIVVSTDVADCAEADLVFTATSDPNPVLFAEHVKPGAWVFDIGRPADVDDSVREVPGVQVVPGGVVRPPGSMSTVIDLHFGTAKVPACMAETMIMTANRAFDRRSLGAVTRSADIAYYLEAGAELGFEIVTEDDGERAAVPA